MIKFTNEIALITAVSDLKMFFDIVNGVTAGFLKIFSRSFGEKSPSGPIKMQIDLQFFKCSYFKIFLELTSANRILLEISNLFKNPEVL